MFLFNPTHRIGDSGSRRELSCFSRTEQSQASTVSGAATTLDSRRSSSADVANGGDDSGAAVCVSSTTTDENKQQAVKSSARRRKRAGAFHQIVDSGLTAVVHTEYLIFWWGRGPVGGLLPGVSWSRSVEARSTVVLVVENSVSR